MQVRKHKEQMSTFIKNKNESRKGKCMMLMLVLNITGTKCAEILFLGTGFVGMQMFDWCFSSAASHPSTPPHSQDSAADVQQKSCIVSAPLWTWPDRCSQSAMSSLIIVGYWFIFEGDDLSAVGGTVSEWCIAWRPDWHVICPFGDFSIKGKSRVVRLSNAMCCW